MVVVASVLVMMLLLQAEMVRVRVELLAFEVLQQVAVAVFEGGASLARIVQQV